MIKLMISDAHGSGECQLAAQHLLQRLTDSARQAGLDVQIDDIRPAPHGLHSAIITLNGDHAHTFAQAWIGTVQWIWQSRLRPRHPRKNWFIGIFPVEDAAPPAQGELRIETCKAGGKGGQHVNKTQSAIRITDTASGISVKVQDERSQHLNKALALQRLAQKQAQQHGRMQREQARERHRSHWQINRGGAVKVFVGDAFKER